MDDPIDFVEGEVKEPGKELKAFIDKNLTQIESSEVFLSLFTTSFEKSPLCMLQFSLAIFLDKPIYLLVEEGVMPSAKLLKLVNGWEFFKRHDQGSLGKATKVLMDMAKAQGYLKEKK